MKVRFEAKVTRGVSLSPRRFCDLLSPLRGLLLISVAKKNQEKPLGPGYARHSFSLFDRNKTQPQTSKTSEQRLLPGTSRLMDIYRNLPTIKFCADLFPAHRCPSVIKFQIRLEWASVNRSNVLLISKAYFPANEMN